MVEQNGVIIYGKDDSTVPPGMEHVSFHGIVFPYGVKRSVISGKDVWMPATKEDFMSSEQKRTGKRVEDMFDTCNLVSPTQCGGNCFDSEVNPVTDRTYPMNLSEDFLSLGGNQLLFLCSCSLIFAVAKTPPWPL
jgi:hypothetical protein